MTYQSNIAQTPIQGQILFDHITGTFKTYIVSTGWVDIVDEEVTDDRLCELHPGLAELRAALRDAQEKYDAYKALVRTQL